MNKKLLIRGDLTVPLLAFLLCLLAPTPTNAVIETSDVEFPYTITTKYTEVVWENRQPSVILRFRDKTSDDWFRFTFNDQLERNMSSNEILWSDPFSSVSNWNVTSIRSNVPGEVRTLNEELFGKGPTKSSRVDADDSDGPFECLRFSTTELPHFGWFEAEFCVFANDFSFPIYDVPDLTFLVNAGAVKFSVYMEDVDFENLEYNVTGYEFSLEMESSSPLIDMDEILTYYVARHVFLTERTNIGINVLRFAMVDDVILQRIRALVKPIVDPEKGLTKGTYAFGIPTFNKTMFYDPDISMTLRTDGGDGDGDDDEALLLQIILPTVLVGSAIIVVVAIIVVGTLFLLFRRRLQQGRINSLGSALNHSNTDGTEMTEVNENDVDTD